MKTERVKVVTLVRDFDYYPRNTVDRTAVSYMVDALEAGNELPPIIVDKDTRKILDGFHRAAAYLRHFGEQAEIEVEFRKYKNEKEMFLDAVRLNAGHGVKLKRYDQARCGEKAKELKIAKRAMAEALKMTLSRFNKLMEERTAIDGMTDKPIVIKPPIRHKAGQTLTKAQEKIVPKLGGNSQVWYVNQLIHLIENDLIDTESESVMSSMTRLAELLQNFMLEHSE